MGSVNAYAWPPLTYAKAGMPEAVTCACRLPIVDRSCPPIKITFPRGPISFGKVWICSFDTRTWPLVGRISSLGSIPGIKLRDRGAYRECDPGFRDYNRIAIHIDKSFDREIIAVSRQQHLNVLRCSM